MGLSSSTCTRGLFVFEVDGSGIETIVHIEAVVAIARCSQCKRRFRVLPADVLPRKHYSLQVIGSLAEQYLGGDRGLREVAWGVHGERTPSHTALHGWTEGLGAHALGRMIGELQETTPIAALMSETASRWPQVSEAWSAEVFVDQRRYRSEERHERLVQMSRLLGVAWVVTELSAKGSLTAWRCLGLGFRLLSSLVFRSGISCTRIEHRALDSRPGSLHQSGGTEPWSTPTRSRRGASSRSPP